MAIIRDASDWLATRGINWLRAFPGATPKRVTDGQVWLASIGDQAQPVATIALMTEADSELWGADERTALFVHGLAVRRSAGGLGIGGALLGFAEDQAARHALPWVRLDCNKNNTELQAYYRSQGFSYIRTIDLAHRNTGALFQKAAARVSNIHQAGQAPDIYSISLGAR